MLQLKKEVTVNCVFLPLKKTIGKLNQYSLPIKAWKSSGTLKFTEAFRSWTLAISGIAFFPPALDYRHQSANTPTATHSSTEDCVSILSYVLKSLTDTPSVQSGRFKSAGC